MTGVAKERGKKKGKTEDNLGGTVHQGKNQDRERDEKKG